MRDVPLSTANIPVFRELSGIELAEILTHDLEEKIFELLASGEFRRKALEHFEKRGKFGIGAAYPVVAVAGQFRIKVYTSVESARTREAMPPPFGIDIDILLGEEGPDSEEVYTADVKMGRVIGTDTANAVDRVRKEVGITPLIPKRNEAGLVVNSAEEHEVRKADYAIRMANKRETERLRDEALANENNNPPSNRTGNTDDSRP